MLDRIRLGKVVMALESHYRLKRYIYIREERDGIEEIFLLKDMDGIVNPNLLEILEIIIEYSLDRDIEKIISYVPENDIIYGIVSTELGSWINEILNKKYGDYSKYSIYVIQICKILDYIFRNFKTFLSNISDGISDSTPVNLTTSSSSLPIRNESVIFRSIFVNNIDLLFFLMMTCPSIHKGLITDDIIIKFIQILKIDENKYNDIISKCNKCVISVILNVFNICNYSVKEGFQEKSDISKKFEIYKKTKSFQGIITNKVKLTTQFGIRILLLVVMQIRPIESKATPKRKSILSKLPVKLAY